MLAFFFADLGLGVLAKSNGAQVVQLMYTCDKSDKCHGSKCEAFHIHTLLAPTCRHCTRSARLDASTLNVLSLPQGCLDICIKRDVTRYVYLVGPYPTVPHNAYRTARPETMHKKAQDKEPRKQVRCSKPLSSVATLPRHMHAPV